MKSLPIKFIFSIVLSCIVTLLVLAEPGFAQQGKPQNQLSKNGDEALKQIKRELDINKNYAKALVLTQQAVNRFNSNLDFRFLHIKALVLNKQHERAAQEITRYIQKNSKNLDIYLLSASNEINRSRYNQALAYLNLGLKNIPNNLTLQLKKLDIFDLVHNYTSGDALADTVYHKFQGNNVMRKAYINYHLSAAGYFSKRGLQDLSTKHYEKVLEISPADIQAIKGNVQSFIASGDKTSALNYINSLLNKNPNAYEYLVLKLNLLEEQHLYPEANEVLNQLKRSHPNANWAKRETELTLNSARYYKSMDPYYQYLKVLERNPGNEEAFNSVMEMSIAKGNYEEALSLINKRLNSNPNQPKLLSAKVLILQKQGKLAATTNLLEKIYRLQPQNRDVKNQLVDQLLSNARAYIADQQTDSAILIYQKVLDFEPKQLQALEGLSNTYLAQKKYTAALSTIDKAIQFYPAQTALQFKKASIYIEDQQFDNAIDILERLKVNNARDAKVIDNLADLYAQLGRAAMRNLDYDAALPYFLKAQENKPKDKEIYTAIINLYLAFPDSAEQALKYANLALEDYDGDRELLTKKSEALARLNRFDEALAISQKLRSTYTFNPNLKALYIDQLALQAQYAKKINDTTLAAESYKKILMVNAKDTLSMMALSNLYFEQAKYAQSLQYAQSASALAPNNATFKLKQAAALEQMADFKTAALMADSVVKLAPTDLRYIDYANYLHSRTFRNQFGLMYLYSNLEDNKKANLASLQYSYLSKDTSTYTFRLNYAGRDNGAGIQGELDLTQTHGKRWRSNLIVGLSNTIVFPKLKAGYSIEHDLNKSFSVELGARYLKLDSMDTYSGLLGLSKTFGSFWLNLKGYVSVLPQDKFFTGILNIRQYLNDKNDYVSAIVGYGNSPDDYSTLHILKENFNYNSTFVGAGYQKTFNYRNTFGIQGTWYNQKMPNSSYRNQYDVFISFLRKF